MIHIVIMAMIILKSTPTFAQGDVDIKRKISASEVAESMFGPVSKIEARKQALNLGSIGINAHTSLNCGKLDLHADFKGEFEHLNSQLKNSVESIMGMLTNPATLAMGAICYYKPNVCSYIRHLTLQMQESLNFQLNACQALDGYIDSQADKGMKQRKSEQIAECMNQAGGITRDNFRKCSNVSEKARNLLYPTQTRWTDQKQDALKGLLTAAKKDKNYDLWSKVLGEIEIKENGWWQNVFTRGVMNTEDLVSNIMFDSQNYACDFDKLEGIVSSREAIEPEGQLSEPEAIKVFIKKVIKEKITPSIVRDLKSLPSEDMIKACNSLGHSIAEVAINKLSSEGKSTMVTALNNDALSDDLKAFYQNQTEVTFSSINAAIKAKTVIPLAQNLEQIRKLALSVRGINREEASKISSMRLNNEQNKNKDNCTDEFSCRR